MGAILEIIAAIVKPLSKLWMRKQDQADDPVIQAKKRYEQIDKDIASGDSMAATSHATSDLDELDRLQNRSTNPR